VRIEIRTANTGDLGPMVAIEKYSFAEPWARKDFSSCMRRLNIQCKVVIVDDQVVGYVMYTSHLTHNEIINFAIHWEFRRQGVGTQVIDYLVARLKGTSLLSFVVSEYNLEAQLFLKECGFRCITVIKGHYPETDEDAYEMMFDKDALWLSGNAVPE